MYQEDSLVSDFLPISGSPLLEGILCVQKQIVLYKERVKEFYFGVLLSQYVCPKCEEEITMVGQSQCSCLSGHTFDPTLEFQQSSCCNVRLVQKTFHYACSRCHQTVPSRFLFDERLFDKAYFKQMMQESRDRTKKKRQEVGRLLAESRSDILILLQEPNLEAIPGFKEALDGFIGIDIDLCAFSPNSGFNVDCYRDHILSVLGMGTRLFSDLPPIMEDRRKDKIWRFVTLIFMQQDGDVSLTQYGPDILVERIKSEAHC